jgi:two-component system, NtrC family, nitrogen regulation sensor histidine kinase NtrY
VKTLKKHILFFLSALLFVIAFVSYTITDKGPISATEDNYLTSVQIKVQEEIRLSDADLGIIKIKLNDGITFSKLSIATQHPYYIYKDTTLVYWSDHRFVPEYPAIIGNYKLKVFDLDAGKFIINKDVVTTDKGSFQIYSVINLYRKYNIDTQNKYLQSGYNLDIFSVEPQGIGITNTANTLRNITSDKKEFLFSINPPKTDVLKNQSVPNNIILMGALGILLMGLYVLSRLKILQHSRNYELGFLLLAGYLILLRVVMLYYRIPFTFQESELFNSTFYAYNDLSPSLGDLLLNVLVYVILLLYIVTTYYRSKSYRTLVDSPRLHLPISLLVMVLSGIAMIWIHSELNHIYTHSQYQLGFKLSVDFMDKPLKIACLVIFILLSAAYFLSLHFLSSIFIRLHRKQLFVGIGIIIIFSCINIAFCYFSDSCSAILMAINGLYFLILFISKFPRFLYNFRYHTSIYFFVGALASALIGTYVVYLQELQKDFELKQQFGKKHLSENDEFAEVMIDKAHEAISHDIELKKLMSQPIFASQLVQSQIRDHHLDLYFQRYNLDVTLFDRTGRNVDVPVVNADGTTPNTYSAYEVRYRQDRYKTHYKDLYFVSDTSTHYIKQYISFVPLRNRDSTVYGYVIMDLHQRETDQQGGVFSGLLETTLEQAPEASAFSYAIFDGTHIVSSGGEPFNFEKKFQFSFLQNSTLFEKGIKADGFNHVGVKGKNKRVIIVTSKELPSKSIFATFSFLFLLLVVSIIFIILIYAVRYGFSRLNINFATRIQIYLNIAFLLPLVLVVGITLGIISNTIKESQNNSNMNLTKNISSKFQGVVEKYAQNTLSQLYLIEELQRTAKESGRDVSVFNAKGELIGSSKESLYEKGLLSRHINPITYIHLIEDREREKLVPESLGDLHFNAAYASLETIEGRLLGVACVPFYDSKVSFEKQVIDVIGSILNTFTSIFIILLVLSYFASNMLTVPLRLITQKIRRINLDKLNEPLEWKSNDEIGLLIGEYNKMLLKLQESKDALSASEKQTAWREMAKQVAHEIKNPLTPMKLNLQMIQRMLDNDNPRAKQLMGRTLGSLIDQIDNISDIANSFSDFATMPIPRQERFDIVLTIQSAVALHDDENIDLIREIPQKEINVLGDRQMIGRIITNLILNGIQAVPAWRKPEIHVKLYEGIDSVTLEVTDNGTGIPENIRNKVFMPNFSTKRDGSGVGLAVAKRGVEHAGGSIWFDTSDEGTTFYISLPLVRK